MAGVVTSEKRRATIEAWSKDEIKLPAVPLKTPKSNIRYAAGFIMGLCGVTDTPHPYTAYTIAEFLG